MPGIPQHSMNGGLGQPQPKCETLEIKCLNDNGGLSKFKRLDIYPRTRMTENSY
jgi:hypothetical protein